jgi:hypothetical protein
MGPIFELDITVPSTSFYSHPSNKFSAIPPNFFLLAFQNLAVFLFASVKIFAAVFNLYFWGTT